MALLHHICAVRSIPRHEILETEIPDNELADNLARLKRSGWETIFTIRTLIGAPRARRVK